VDTVDKLTVGSMARYTLASYAVRDAGLREYLRANWRNSRRRSRRRSAKVIEAADTVQLGAVRKDALAAVEELKAKGSDARRNLDFGAKSASARRAGLRLGGGTWARSRSASLRDRRLGVRRACCHSGKKQQ